MPTPKCCICTIPLGSKTTNCDSTTGISELNYTASCNVIGVTFAGAAGSPAPDCCPEGEIETFTLDFADPGNPEPEELLQPITFVQQDDDTGAVFDIDTNYDGGNKTRNRTVSFQVEGHDKDTDCALDSMVGKEVAFHVKFKDGSHKLVNWSGGMRVTNVAKSSNTSYWTVTMTGRPNDRDLFINAAWANANIVPISTNPSGLVNG